MSGRSVGLQDDYNHFLMHGFVNRMVGQTFSITGKELQLATEVEGNWKSEMVTDAKLESLRLSVRSLNLYTMSIADSVNTIISNFEALTDDVSNIAAGLTEAFDSIAETRANVQSLRAEVRQDEWIAETVAQLQNAQAEANSLIASEGSVPVIGSSVVSAEQTAENIYYASAVNMVEAMRFESAKLHTWTRAMLNRYLSIVSTLHSIKALDLSVLGQQHAELLRSTYVASMIHADQIYAHTTGMNGEFFAHTPHVTCYMRKVAMRTHAGSILVPNSICMNFFFPADIPTLSYVGVKNGSLSRQSLYVSVQLDSTAMGDLSEVQTYAFLSNDVIDLSDGSVTISKVDEIGSHDFEHHQANYIGDFPLYCDVQALMAVVEFVRDAYQDRHVMDAYRQIINYLCTPNPQFPPHPRDEVKQGDYLEFAQMHYQNFSIGGVTFYPGHHLNRESIDAALLGNDSGGVAYSGTLSAKLNYTGYKTIRSEISNVSPEYPTEDIVQLVCFSEPSEVLVNYLTDKTSLLQ
jgi:hypothetical protein